MAAKRMPPSGKNPGSTSLSVGVTLSQSRVPSGISPGSHTMRRMGDQDMNPCGPPPMSGANIFMPQNAPQGQLTAATSTRGTTLNSTALSASGGIIQATVPMVPRKQKSLKSLINELAHMNKIYHQYTLVAELGPPHKKMFTVLLKLGNEEHIASGLSIKKAQQAAAAVALAETCYEHPPLKSQRKVVRYITPVVELRDLAIARGEQAVYQLIKPDVRPRNANLTSKEKKRQRSSYPKFVACIMSLKVGNRQFFGEGPTISAARHSAAEKALDVLRCAPFPNQVKEHSEDVKSKEEDGYPYSDDDHVRSPISLVHKIANKRRLSVRFEVIEERGVPHLHTYVTRCCVENCFAFGKADSKKLSKKRAAENMLEELKKLPSLPPSEPSATKKAPVKKKNKHLMKVQNMDSQFGPGTNPVGLLVEIQQSKKEMSPIFSVINEVGVPHNMVFTMQCSIGDLIATGKGPTKRVAKRRAAEAMLKVMSSLLPTN